MIAGNIIGGKYRMLRQIGRGAMGVVWAAVNETTSREVAIKVVHPDPDLRLRLQREARACGALAHRNIVDVYDVAQTDDGEPVLVMQLLVGETLADFLVRKRRLTPSLAAFIGREIARALVAAHALNIVHRDLKPANIFLHREPDADGPVVKVLDFGVAKNLTAKEIWHTAAGGAVGSPLYMSPEQARAQRDVDVRADLWSLGVVLFELLTGKRPFQGEFGQVISQITGRSGDEIPKVSRFVRHVDPRLVEIVAGCMCRDRDQRLGPAAEMAKMLDAFVGPDNPWIAPAPSVVSAEGEAAEKDRERGAPLPVPPLPLPAIDESDAVTTKWAPRMLTPFGHRAPAPSEASLRPPSEPPPPPASAGRFGAPRELDLELAPTFPADALDGDATVHGNPWGPPRVRDRSRDAAPVAPDGASDWVVHGGTVTLTPEEAARIRAAHAPAARPAPASARPAPPPMPPAHPARVALAPGATPLPVTVPAAMPALGPAGATQVDLRDRRAQGAAVAAAALTVCLMSALLFLVLSWAFAPDEAQAGPALRRMAPAVREAMAEVARRGPVGVAPADGPKTPETGGAPPEPATPEAQKAADAQKTVEAPARDPGVAPGKAPAPVVTNRPRVQRPTADPCAGKKFLKRCKKEEFIY